MAEIPAFMFYIATGALVIVSVFILIFLIYLIVAVRVVLGLVARIEAEGRRWRDRFRFVRRMAGGIGSLFDI